MPNYQYHAIDNTGKLLRGTVVAFNEGDVDDRLTKRDLTLIKSKQVHKQKWAHRLFEGKVKARVLIEFYQRLSQSLKIGLPILATLDENIKMIPCQRLKQVIEEVKVSVENGNTLYEAMEHFPDVFQRLDLSIIMMGEQSGTLPGSLEHLADFLEWKEDLRSTIKRATIYPSFILVALLAVVGVWVGYVLPQMAKTLSDMGIELPTFTRAILAMSLFLQSNWPWLMGAILVLVVSAYLFQRTRKGKLAFHKYLLKVPLIGRVLSNTVNARLSHYFSVLMNAGMTINRIFEMLIGGILGNRYLEGQLGVAYQEIQQGRTISQGFEMITGFPPLLIGAVRNGEWTGTLDESFGRLSDYYDREVKTTVNAMINAFEPIIMLLLGGIFGVILLSIMLPLYDVVAQMGKAY